MSNGGSDGRPRIPPGTDALLARLEAARPAPMTSDNDKPGWAREALQEMKRLRAAARKQARPLSMRQLKDKM